ncbi:unnamed protein product [Camellia sinensis]
MREPDVDLSCARDQSTRTACVLFIRHLQPRYRFQSLLANADHAAHSTRRWFAQLLRQFGTADFDVCSLRRRLCRSALPRLVFIRLASSS